MRKILFVVLGLVPSCSWLFQTHLESEYSGNSEPVCSTSGALAGLDGVWSGLNLIGAIVIASDNSSTVQNKDSAVAAGIVEGILFGASAITGESWASDCRKAREDWDARQVERPHLAVMPEVTIRPVPVTAPPRGFYCVTSASTPAAGFCMRGRVACITAHDAAVNAVADITECTLVESAWCFDDGRCAPTREVCAEQRSKHAGDLEPRDCVEAR